MLQTGRGRSFAEHSARPRSDLEQILPSAPFPTAATVMPLPLSSSVRFERMRRNTPSWRSGPSIIGAMENPRGKYCHGPLSIPSGRQGQFRRGGKARGGPSPPGWPAQRA